MQRLLAALLAVILVLLSAGCGSVFVGGVIQPGVSSVNGFISVVQITVVGGTMVTSVTFLGGGTSSTLGFCGDQRRHFPMSQNVRTDFNPGTSCNNLVAVVIL